MDQSCDRTFYYFFEFFDRSKTVLRYACFRQRLHNREAILSPVTSKAFFRLMRAAGFQRSEYAPLSPWFHHCPMFWADFSDLHCAEENCELYLYFCLSCSRVDSSEDVIHQHRVKKKGKTLLNISYNEPLHYFFMSLKTETQSGMF